MTKIENLKIYIVSVDGHAIKMMERAFRDVENVEAYWYDIKYFYKEHKDEIDCLVSPANAFGFMTGGYDAALSDILGWNFQYKVREYIDKHFYGEQPVTSSFIIDTDIPGLKLIHTPTMQYPSLIEDENIVYYATRSTLICALKNNVKCIVLPIFGGDCGGVDASVTSELMKKAYLQIRDRIKPDSEF